MSSPADKLTIETPEQTALEFSLAGVGSRFLALAVDTLLQVVAFLALFLLVLVIGAAAWPAASTWSMAIGVLLFSSLYYGYFAFFEAIWKGQTPGKRHAKLRVIKDSGRPINAYEAIARNLLRLVDQLPGIYAVGIVAALVSKQNKRLGDLVAGTVVIHEKPFEQLQPGWELFARSDAPALPYKAVRLSAEEFQLVEAFLQRRSELPDEVRRQTAQAIAQRVGARLEVPPEERSSPEPFLERLVRAARSAGRLR